MMATPCTCDECRERCQALMGTPYKEATPVKPGPGEIEDCGMCQQPGCQKCFDARVPLYPNKTNYPHDTRVFQTGATRGMDSEKLDYSGFISPIVLKRFSEYMHLHRIQTDGKLRSSRNWRKGMPVTSYEESLIRHSIDVWLHSEGFGKEATEDLETALCGVIFNAQGLLHENLLIKKGLNRGRIE